MAVVVVAAAVAAVVVAVVVGLRRLRPRRGMVRMDGGDLGVGHSTGMVDVHHNLGPKRFKNLYIEMVWGSVILANGELHGFTLG